MDPTAPTLRPNSPPASVLSPSRPFALRIALLLSAAIAISYLDRQTLPWAIKAIQSEIPITNQIKAFLDSAFLATYGLMYLGGGALIDRLGTRRGFLCVMIFWSIACASHGFATSVLMLGASRLLLGAGEGGGFPAATRAIAEWFPIHQRATAMGIVNGGSAIGAVVAPPLIAMVLTHAHWLQLSPWRWVFFLTGSLGLLWSLLWYFNYSIPLSPNPKSSIITSFREANVDAGQLTGRAWEAHHQSSIIAPSLKALLPRREILALILAKFLSDAAWYFYLFWLPKYLFDVHHFDIKQASNIGWIPYAASGIGCLCGGGLSSYLLARGRTVNFSRKTALALSAALMPWVLFVPAAPNIPVVIAIFSAAFFGHQSWSTIVMILPTDLVPRESLGKVAGLVGLGGAMGGVVLGQFAGWMLDHGFSYTPVLAVAASLHLIAFAVICLAIPKLEPLLFKNPQSDV